MFVKYETSVNIINTENARAKIVLLIRFLKALRQLATVIPNARDFLGEDVNDQTLNILRGAINYISVLDCAIQQKRKEEKQ